MLGHFGRDAAGARGHRATRRAIAHVSRDHVGLALRKPPPHPIGDALRCNVVIHGFPPWPNHRRGTCRVNRLVVRTGKTFSLYFLESRAGAPPEWPEAPLSPMHADSDDPAEQLALRR